MTCNIFCLLHAWVIILYSIFVCNSFHGYIADEDFHCSILITAGLFFLTVLLELRDWIYKQSTNHNNHSHLSLIKLWLTCHRCFHVQLRQTNVKGILIAKLIKNKNKILDLLIKFWITHIWWPVIPAELYNVKIANNIKTKRNKSIKNMQPAFSPSYSLILCCYFRILEEARLRWLVAEQQSDMGAYLQWAGFSTYYKCMQHLVEYAFSHNFTMYFCCEALHAML